MDELNRIKRLVFRGRVRYTIKAIDEMAVDNLERTDVEESILNAQAIDKVLRPHSKRGRTKGKLYVIKSFSYQGTLIYSKGKINREGAEEYFYILVSAKLSTD